jgi:hypothetical protein
MGLKQAAQGVTRAQLWMRLAKKRASTGEKSSCPNPTSVLFQDFLHLVYTSFRMLLVSWKLLAQIVF